MKQALQIIENEIEIHMDTLAQKRSQFISLGDTGRLSQKRKIVLDIAELERAKHGLLALRDNLILRGEL